MGSLRVSVYAQVLANPQMRGIRTLNKPTYNKPRYNKPRYNKPRYDKPRYDKPRYNKPRYNKPRYNKPRHGGPPEELQTRGILSERCCLLHDDATNRRHIETRMAMINACTNITNTYIHAYTYIHHMETRKTMLFLITTSADECTSPNWPRQVAGESLVVCEVEEAKGTHPHTQWPMAANTSNWSNVPRKSVSYFQV